MQEESIRFVWWRHLLVAVGYAAAYVLLRSVSVSNWNLPASLRLAALLLVPMRYWPALVLGEAMPVAYQAWLSHGMFGWAWASFAAFPPMALCAPFMAWFRRRTMVVQADGRVDIPAVLTAALACAVLTAAGNVAALASVHMPAGQPAPAITARIVFGYFLGNYLGALTLAPLALAVRGWLAGTRPAVAWASLRRSGLLRDGAMSLLLPLTALAGIGYASENADAMQVCRIAMFVPVAWLTLRHGWRGAAFGGAAASCAVALTSTIVRDPSVIQAQAIIAFAISTLLMLGTRLAQTASGEASAQRERVDREYGLLLAQQGLYQEELRMKHAAEALEQVRQSMRDMQNRLLDHLRDRIPANEERAYTRQAALAQHEMHRLTNALYPRVWREQGETSTVQLRDGPVAMAAAAIGATYECELVGQDLEHLASDVHMTLYRLAGESLVYALSRQATRHVDLVIRGGHSQGMRWVVMRMDCHRASATDGGMRLAQDQWKKAMSLLGTSGQGIETIRERAQIYGGDAHVRENPLGLRVTVLLHDALRGRVDGARVSAP
ncbi:MASE1 domain-containing protein [Dyella sp. SG609]|uniref:MASE1 domain-containing protein n=1 Tax=unclassified Dyella TaxID=2634549 RepID=UPI001446B9B9|nr:MASE1 domain-containing protein [Dyella sp. SG609]NKJ20157.1 glucose-6-phosphate-specific signal transduction histidine kinase [Dyella sp. SG609]